MDDRSDVVVLLVEDDDTYQEVLERTLFRAGYTVHLAVTVPEMVTRLSTSRVLPHLVVLDWYVPGEDDGLKALVWIRAHPDSRIQTLPVLVLTAGRNPEQIRRVALNAGASECLPKSAPMRQVVDSANHLVADGPGQACDSPREHVCPIRLIGHQAFRPGLGTRVSLTPKQAHLLGILLERPGELVPYAVLESRLFPLGQGRRERLRRRVYSLNQRLAGLGARVRSSRRGEGYCLRCD